MDEREARELAEKIAEPIAWAIVLGLLVSAFAGVTWLVCWGFGIEWSWRFEVGVAALVIVVRIAFARGD